MSEGNRVLIVAEDASEQFGGEAVLPLHYFRVLRGRGVEAWLVVHERTRGELDVRFAAEKGRIFYVPDTWVHKRLWSVGRRLPHRLALLVAGAPMHWLTQWMQRRLVKRLVRALRVDVVHEPAPVSPRQPSMMFGLGVPVVIGPMNGGMDYPPAFRGKTGAVERAVVGLGRAMSGVLNVLVPGKRQAAVLVVANQRTRKALSPALGSRARVVELVENGVDLTRWRPPPPEVAGSAAGEEGGVRFVFLGRLVDWKAVDILLRALAVARRNAAVELEVIGDGPERGRLEALARELGVEKYVRFMGFLPQAEAAERLAKAQGLMLSSLYECGGAVVLEAMACGLPVAATAWGGPMDYLDLSCGILVQPN
ncbi:MAG: glycosyltransferase family 4 protein, partial [Phycisphaeraceae bacterium]|nr:glycosyltransferase family 4 protein [Phycisphaeraceae bacterium]